MINEKNQVQIKLNLRIGIYSYGARWYDAGIARWTSVDPMAEKRAWMSPYSYVQNNPVLRTDLNGALDSPGPSTSGNPLMYMAEGFRQYFQAAGKFIDNTYASVTTSMSRTVKEVGLRFGMASGKQTTTTEASTKTKVSTNFGEFLSDKNRDNKPDGSLFKVDTKTDVTINSKLELSGSVDGVNIVGSNTSKASLLDGKISSETEVSSPIKLGKVDAAIGGFINSTSIGQDFGFKAKVSASASQNKVIITLRIGYENK